MNKGLIAVLTALAILAGYGMIATSGPPGSGAQKGAATWKDPEGLVPVKGSKAPTEQTEVATFAAGCFWGVEQEFREEKGVLATAVGYSGGRTERPTYEQVCTNTTGHAESVRLRFDPKVTTYEKLLKLFWELHDPTTKNRQGPDFGSQYRSVIFYNSPQQKQAAIASRDALNGSGELKNPIVTEIVPAAPFWKAEEYHQQYVEKGGQSACRRRKGGS